jgi:hypothetical protein
MLSGREMSQSRNQAAVECHAIKHRPIEYLTKNGFTIVRLTEPNGKPGFAGEYDFLVGDPHGYELEITVEVDTFAFTEIALRSRGRISSESSYWICCAERHLATYLSENDDYPPNEKLKVTQLSLDDLNLAVRWGRESNI